MAAIHEPSRVVSLADIAERQVLARYAHLLSGLTARTDGVLLHRLRGGTGLVTIAVQHGALTGPQRRALGEYRRDQSLLCGFYDLAYLLARGIETDPALEAFPAGGIHVIVGTADGLVLAYFCLQPSPEHEPTHVMADTTRPLFHVEAESFGPAVFASLPAVGALALRDVRECSTLLRNQAVRSHLAVLATLEVLIAIAQLQVDPRCAMRATLGCIRLDARRVMQRLGMPLLYAPDASIVMDGLPPYWRREWNAPGEFWPCVAATDDLLAHREYFRRLDAALSLEPRAIRRAVDAVAEQGSRPIPHAFVPAPGASRLVWTADPFYGLDLKPRRRPGDVGGRRD